MALTNYTGTAGQTPWYSLWTSMLTEAESRIAALEAISQNNAETSNSSNSIATGAQTFVINESNRSFTVGGSFQIYRLSSPSTAMAGTVTSWTSGTKTVVFNITTVAGSGGPYTDWVITPFSPAVLPPQAASPNSALRTNGSTASWSPITSAPVRSGTALQAVYSAVVSAAGTGYVPGNTIVLTGGTATTQATLSVTQTQLVSLTGSGGTGYAVNDTINLTSTGGTTVTAAVVKVTSVSSGAITGLSIVNAGAFTGNPTGFTQNTTSGSGSGATFATPGFGVFLVSPTIAGSYTAAPANPVAQGSTSGSGTGATFTVSFGTLYVATQADLGNTQNYTSALGILTLPAMSTLLANFVIYVYANGGAVTIFQTGTDTLNGTAGPVTVAKGNQAQIILTSAASPGAATVIQTSGVVTLPNTGAQNTITASATLTAASPQLQRVVMAATGQTITLPAATTIQTGGAPFVIKADGNSLGFPVRDAAGNLIAYQAPGDTVTYGLIDNSTAAGVWAPITAQQNQAGIVNTPAVFSSTATNNSRMAIESLTATTALLVYYPASGTTVYSTVVTINAATGALSFSTPQSLTVTATGGPLSLKAFTSTSGVMGMGGQLVYGWTLSGTTVSLGASLTLINPSNPVYGAPQFDLLFGSTTQCLCAYNSTSSFVTAVTVLTLSGNTVSQGAPSYTTQPNSGSPTSTMAPAVLVLSATKAVVISTTVTQGGYESPIAFNTVTLSGTTIISFTVTQYTNWWGASANQAQSALNWRLVAASATTAILVYFPFDPNGTNGGPLTLIAYSVTTGNITAMCEVSIANEKGYSANFFVTQLKRASNGRFYAFVVSPLNNQGGAFDFCVVPFYYDDNSGIFSVNASDKLHISNIGSYYDTGACINGTTNTATVVYSDPNNSYYGTAVRVELAA